MRIVTESQDADPDLRVLPLPCAPAQERRREASSLELAMSRYLVGNPVDRRLFGSHGGSGKGFHHLAGAFGIGDPFVVELIGTRRDTAIAFAGIDHPGVTAMHQLEE